MVIEMITGENVRFLFKVVRNTVKRNQISHGTKFKRQFPIDQGKIQLLTNLGNKIRNDGLKT